MYIGSWQWIDTTNVPGPLDWVAFILGGAGILFTLVQLLRSKGALKAAQDALESTRSTLIKNQLLAVLPGFQEIMASIELSVQSNEREQLNDGLSRFAYRLREAAALLEESPGNFQQMVSDMISAAETAMSARSLLFGSPKVTAENLIGESVVKLRLLVLEIHGLAISIKNDPGKALNDKKGL